MKWNKEPEPFDNQARITTKFAWFPVSVAVSNKENPIEIFQYGTTPRTTRRVWLEKYYNYSIWFSFRWLHIANFIIEEITNEVVEEQPTNVRHLHSISNKE